MDAAGASGEPRPAASAGGAPPLEEAGSASAGRSDAPNNGGLATEDAELSASEPMAAETGLSIEGDGAPGPDVDAHLWRGAAAAGWRIVPRGEGADRRGAWNYISPVGVALRTKLAAAAQREQHEPAAGGWRRAEALEQLAPPWDEAAALIARTASQEPSAHTHQYEAAVEAALRAAHQAFASGSVGGGSSGSGDGPEDLAAPADVAPSAESAPLSPEDRLSSIRRMARDVLCCPGSEIAELPSQLSPLRRLCEPAEALAKISAGEWGCEDGPMLTRACDPAELRATLPCWKTAADALAAGKGDPPGVRWGAMLDCGDLRASVRVRIKRPASWVVEQFDTPPADRTSLLNVVHLLRPSDVTSPSVVDVAAPPEPLALADASRGWWGSGSPFLLLSMRGSSMSYHIDLWATSVLYTVMWGCKVIVMAPPTQRNRELFRDWAEAGERAGAAAGGTAGATGYGAGVANAGVGRPGTRSGGASRSGESRNGGGLAHRSEQGKQNKASEGEPREGSFPQELEGAQFATLLPGQALFLPCGWIHAVFTPEDSGVLGWNWQPAPQLPAALGLILGAEAWGGRVAAEIRDEGAFPLKAMCRHLARLLARYVERGSDAGRAGIQAGGKAGIPGGGQAGASKERSQAVIPEGGHHGGVGGAGAAPGISIGACDSDGVQGGALVVSPSREDAVVASIITFLAALKLGRPPAGNGRGGALGEGLAALARTLALAAARIKLKLPDFLEAAIAAGPARAPPDAPAAPAAPAMNPLASITHADAAPGATCCRVAAPATAPAGSSPFSSVRSMTSVTFLPSVSSVALLPPSEPTALTCAWQTSLPVRTRAVAAAAARLGTAISEDTRTASDAAVVPASRRRGWEEPGARADLRPGQPKGAPPHPLSSRPQTSSLPRGLLPLPGRLGRALPRWSAAEDAQLLELVLAAAGQEDVGAGARARWAAVALALGTGRSHCAVEQRYASLNGRPSHPFAAAMHESKGGRGRGRGRGRDRGGRGASRGRSVHIVADTASAAAAAAAGFAAGAAAFGGYFGTAGASVFETAGDGGARVPATARAQARGVPTGSRRDVPKRRAAAGVALAVSAAGSWRDEGEDKPRAARGATGRRGAGEDLGAGRGRGGGRGVAGVLRRPGRAEENVGADDGGSVEEEEEDLSEGEEEEEEGDEERFSMVPGHSLGHGLGHADYLDAERRHAVDAEADEMARAFADHEASAVARRFAIAEAEAMAHDTSLSPSSTPEYMGEEDAGEYLGEGHGGAEGGLGLLFRMHAPRSQCSILGEPGKEELPAEIGGAQTEVGAAMQTDIGGEIHIKIASSGVEMGVSACGAWDDVAGRTCEGNDGGCEDVVGGGEATAVHGSTPLAASHATLEAPACTSTALTLVRTLESSLDVAPASAPSSAPEVTPTLVPATAATLVPEAALPAAIHASAAVSETPAAHEMASTNVTAQESGIAAASATEAAPAAASPPCPPAAPVPVDPSPPPHCAPHPPCCLPADPSAPANPSPPSNFSPRAAPPAPPPLATGANLDLDAINTRITQLVFSGDLLVLTINSIIGSIEAALPPATPRALLTAERELLKRFIDVALKQRLRMEARIAREAAAAQAAGEKEGGQAATSRSAAGAAGDGGDAQPETRRDMAPQPAAHGAPPARGASVAARGPGAGASADADGTGEARHARGYHSMSTRPAGAPDWATAAQRGVDTRGAAGSSAAHWAAAPSPRNRTKVRWTEEEHTRVAALVAEASAGRSMGALSAEGWVEVAAKLASGRSGKAVELAYRARLAKAEAAGPPGGIGGTPGEGAPGVIGGVPAGGGGSGVEVSPCDVDQSTGDARGEQLAPERAAGGMCGTAMRGSEAEQVHGEDLARTGAGAISGVAAEGGETAVGAADGADTEGCPAGAVGAEDPEALSCDANSDTDTEQFVPPQPSCLAVRFGSLVTSRGAQEHRVPPAPEAPRPADLGETDAGGEGGGGDGGGGGEGFDVGGEGEGGKDGIACGGNGVGGGGDGGGVGAAAVDTEAGVAEATERGYHRPAPLLSSSFCTAGAFALARLADVAECLPVVAPWGGQASVEQPAAPPPPRPRCKCNARCTRGLKHDGRGGRCNANGCACCGLVECRKIQPAPTGGAALAPSALVAVTDQSHGLVREGPAETAQALERVEARTGAPACAAGASDGLRGALRACEGGATPPATESTAGAPPASVSRDQAAPRTADAPAAASLSDGPGSSIALELESSASQPPPTAVSAAMREALLVPSPLSGAPAASLHAEAGPEGEAGDASARGEPESALVLGSPGLETEAAGVRPAVPHATLSLPPVAPRRRPGLRSAAGRPRRAGAAPVQSSDSASSHAAPTPPAPTQSPAVPVCSPAGSDEYSSPSSPASDPAREIVPGHPTAAKPSVASSALASSLAGTDDDVDVFLPGAGGPAAGEAQSGSACAQSGSACAQSGSACAVGETEAGGVAGKGAPVGGDAGDSGDEAAVECGEDAGTDDVAMAGGGTTIPTGGETERADAVTEPLSESQRACNASRAPTNEACAVGGEAEEESAGGGSTLDQASDGRAVGQSNECAGTETRLGTETKLSTHNDALECELELSAHTSEAGDAADPSNLAGEDPNSAVGESNSALAQSNSAGEDSNSAVDEFNSAEGASIASASRLPPPSPPPPAAAPPRAPPAGRNRLRAPVRHGDASRTRALLASNPEPPDQVARLLADAVPHPDVLQLLLDHLAAADTPEPTRPNMPAAEGTSARLRAGVDAGGAAPRRPSQRYLDLQDQAGHTPLSLACATCQSADDATGRSAIALLRAGAPTDTLVCGGRSCALAEACKRPSRLPLVSALLAHGADPRVRTTDVGYTPIMFAAEFNNARAVAVLAAAAGRGGHAAGAGSGGAAASAHPDAGGGGAGGGGACSGAGGEVGDGAACLVHETDESGWTALHWAAQMGSVAALRALLDAGADAGKQTADGRIALQLTRTEECKRALADKGSKKGIAPRAPALEEGAPIAACDGGESMSPPARASRSRNLKRGPIDEPPQPPLSVSRAKRTRTYQAVGPGRGIGAEAEHAQVRAAGAAAAAGGVEEGAADVEAGVEVTPPEDSSIVHDSVKNAVNTGVSTSKGTAAVLPAADPANKPAPANGKRKRAGRGADQSSAGGDAEAAEQPHTFDDSRQLLQRLLGGGPAAPQPRTSASVSSGDRDRRILPFDSLPHASLASACLSLALTSVAAPSSALFPPPAVPPSDAVLNPLLLPSLFRDDARLLSLGLSIAQPRNWPSPRVLLHLLTAAVDASAASCTLVLTTRIDRACLFDGGAGRGAMALLGMAGTGAPADDGAVSLPEMARALQSLLARAVGGEQGSPAAPGTSLVGATSHASTDPACAGPTGGTSASALVPALSDACTTPPAPPPLASDPRRRRVAQALLLSLCRRRCTPAGDSAPLPPPLLAPDAPSALTHRGWPRACVERRMVGGRLILSCADLSEGAEALPVPWVNATGDGALPNSFVYSRHCINADAAEAWARKPPRPCTGGGRHVGAPDGFRIECTAACRPRGEGGAASSPCPPERGLAFRVEVFRHERGDVLGWGLRAREPIPKGAFVMEYVGEHVSAAEAARRVRCVEDTDVYLMSLQASRAARGGHAIDALHVRNVSAFANFSCQPNLELQPVLSLHWDARLPHAAFFALRRIEPGEELCYRRDDARGKQDEGEAVPCSCGAFNCSGWL